MNQSKFDRVQCQRKKASNAKCHGGKNCLSAKLNRVFGCHDFKTKTKINLGKVNGQQEEMKRENESPKTMNSVAHNVLPLCEGGVFQH
jgi:ribulose 1,5-bisphosphate carboxylase large subunit-like protein